MEKIANVYVNGIKHAEIEFTKQTNSFAFRERGCCISLWCDSLATLRELIGKRKFYAGGFEIKPLAKYRKLF